jgi:hypothetical protein
METTMGKPPYEDADALDLMRADADQVELSPIADLRPVGRDETQLTEGFEVPSGAVDLGGRLHVYLD